MAATPEGAGDRVADVIRKRLKEGVFCQTGKQQAVHGGCTFTRPRHRGQEEKLVGQDVGHKGYFSAGQG